MIYSLYIRSILEFNSNVWFSSITEQEKDDIERVQKIACKIILKDSYQTYEQALLKLNLQSLTDRRLMLAKRFSQKCVKSDKFNDLFPKNRKDSLNLRNPEEFNVNFARTNRLQKSSIPAMQRILNN